MTEDQLKQETLGWLIEAGYSPLYGLDIAPDGDGLTPQKAKSPDDPTETITPTRNPQSTWALV